MKTESTMKYEIYENNGGGITFVLLENDAIVYLCANLELVLNYKDGAGTARDMIEQLETDPDAWMFWDSYEPRDGEPDAQEIYDYDLKNDYLIAWGFPEKRERNEIDAYLMGDNALTLLGHTEGITP